MFKSIIVAASVLAATVAALPHANANAINEVRREKPLAYWPAANFQKACSPGGCSAGFEIAAPAGYVKGAPAFSVHCHPVYVQQGWSECDVVGNKMAPGSFVQSSWTQASRNDLTKMSVNHIWLDGGARYNASGSAEVPFTQASFEVAVHGVVGVL